MTDLPTPFDPEVVATVAREHDLDPERLRALVVEHQRLVRDTPGIADVSGLVYEWRRAFRRDPVLERRSDVFLLAVEPGIWEEYVAALDPSDAEAAALRAVHRRTVGSLGPDDDREPMVVRRTADAD